MGIKVSVMASVLDRLIDPKSVGTPARPGFSVEQMVAAVRRDLEQLLNTRQAPRSVPEHFSEVGRSIANFGFPDVSGLRASTAGHRQDICRTIERVVSNYEPRVRDVRASAIEPKDKEVGTARFSIEGRLELQDGPQVAFATVLDLASGHTLIQAGVR